MTSKEILQSITKNKIQFVNLQFSDLTGRIKNITCGSNKIEDVLKNGQWFDGSSIEGFARIAESDMLLKPDLNTYHILPWSPPERKAARIICDVFTPQGEPFEGDPRYILKKMMKKVQNLGYQYKVGAEVEFFLFEREKIPELIPHDAKSYFDYTPISRATRICEEVIEALVSFNIKGEIHHHEVAPGQHEIDIKYDEALRSADNILTLKMTIKAFAAQNGLKATFMPKPIRGINGSGMHVHQSFFNPNGQNAFYRESDPYNLSELAYQFIAGQLKHARGFCAIVAPTVNSYKRLVPNYEAPVYICWARRNRSALIRIPEALEKKLEATRTELRCPDPYANPYLAFATMLAAGFDGIQKKLTPPPPKEEDIYHLDEKTRLKANIETLPASLEEALEELNKNEVIKTALGSHTSSRFLEAKRLEWEQYRLEVSPWEVKHYL